MTDLNGITKSTLVQSGLRKPPNSQQSNGDHLLVCKGLTRVWIPGPPNISDLQKPTAKLSFGGFEISLYPAAQKATVKSTPAEAGDVKPASEQKPHGLAWGPHNWDTPKPADAKRKDAIAEELRGFAEELRKVQDAFHKLEISLPSDFKDVAGVKHDSGLSRKSDVETETAEKKSDEAVTLPKEPSKRVSAFKLAALKESLASKQKSASNAHVSNPSFESDYHKHVDAENSKIFFGAVPINKEDAKCASSRSPEGVVDAESSKKNPAGSAPCSKEDTQRAWARVLEGILEADTPKKRSTGLVQLARTMRAETSQKKPAGPPEMRGYSPRAKGKASATTTGSDQDDDGYEGIVNPSTPGKLHYRP